MFCSLFFHFQGGTSASTKGTLRGGRSLNDVKVCNKMCILGHHCENGDCVPDVSITSITPQPSVSPKPQPVVCNMMCTNGYHCENGDCVQDESISSRSPQPSVSPKPHPAVCNKLCRIGYHCKYGDCVPDVSTSPPSQSVQAGDTSCEHVNCGINPAYRCKNGICVYEPF
jgi:hypothetical protein